MYPSRMFFTDKLVGYGCAKLFFAIRIAASFRGQPNYLARKMESPDIRAGMALVLAALSAKSKSVYRNIGQIVRGYEQVDKKN
jgi:UDP-N-acetylglucosamine 1-carboxyvinyltransferase